MMGMPPRQEGTEVSLTQRPLRIVYAAGPGDVVGTYRHWKEGRDDPSQVAITYSGQFYDLCRELGAQAYVISYCPRRETLRDGPFRIEHRPLRFLRGPGPLYHLGQLWAGLRLTATTLRFGADVLLTMGGGGWYALLPLPMLGVKVIPTLHGHLWRASRRPRGMDGFLWRFGARLFRRSSAILFISDSVARQVRSMAGPGLRAPMVHFVPTYRPEVFRGIAEAPAPPAPPFRVFYAGRIERDKGVFHLLDIAIRFASEGRTSIEFDLCGTGGALEELRRKAEEAGVAARFRCHGHVVKSVMRGMYQQCHVVVVPTTSDSIEGLNKVVVESVLARRPVITSRMCPALEYVRDAVEEVPPDDVRAYGDAILRLAEDPGLYEAKVRGCAAATGQFYDPDQGWAATFRRALSLAGLLPSSEKGQAAPSEPAGEAHAVQV
jgi:glycosyltransferase involved in cell wall biosynthesis